MWQFYFRLYRGTIKTPEIINFLGHLQRQLDRKMMIVWDGLAAHRSRGVRASVERTNGMIRLAQLLAYAPELNPVEFIWGYCKRHELPNFCPKIFAQLNQVARSATAQHAAAFPTREGLLAASGSVPVKCHCISKTSIGSIRTNGIGRLTWAFAAPLSFRNDPTGLRGFGLRIRGRNF